MTENSKTPPAKKTIEDPPEYGPPPAMARLPTGLAGESHTRQKLKKIFGAA